MLSNPVNSDLPAAHWSRRQLLERAAHLRQLAQLGDGQASETLEHYPGHAAMLSFRARNGVAELHESFADLFVVLDGEATLITGGAVINAETVATGEIRGAGIAGGCRRALNAGEIAHIPAGLPHQLMVEQGKTFTAFVLKIQQG